MGASTHYLQRGQIAIVFLSFALLALPLSYAQLSTALPPVVAGALLLAYAVLLGNTHFAITWALYLNSANVRHFESSASRKAVYFGVPLVLMVGMAALGVLDLPRPGMLAFVPFSIALAAIDDYHVVRQSFGVLQMFKARAAAPFPAHAVANDNRYFLTLLVLQALTFAGGISHGFDGRFDVAAAVAWPATLVAALTGRAYSWQLVPMLSGMTATVAIVLFVGVVRGFLAAARTPDADRGALGTAFVYLLLQSASALLVVYRSRLYLPSLAMHYVEYHVLMVPRLFAAPLDASSRVDRVASVFRRHKVLFYGLLAGIAGCASAGGVLALAGISLNRNSPGYGWLLVNLLNGLFLSHYFIESFVWKFGNPFYRQTLGPIYFGAARQLTPAVEATGKRRR